MPGVGDKTAAKLVNTYGDIDTLYANLSELTPKLRASLGEHEAQVRLNLQMTPLVSDVPVSCEADDLTLGRSNREEMRSLLDLLEIRGPRDRIFKQLDRLEPLASGGLSQSRDGRIGNHRTGDDRPAEACPRRRGGGSWRGGRLPHGSGRWPGLVALEPVWAAAAGRSPLPGSPSPPLGWPQHLEEMASLMSNPWKFAGSTAASSPAPRSQRL